MDSQGSEQRCAADDVNSERITAIRMLLQARGEGLYNPFPAAAELAEISFSDQTAEVTIRGDLSDLSGEQESMRLALVRTLRHFHIRDVVLHLVT